MGVQTDLKAGWDRCYKCGNFIYVDIDVEIDVDIHFGSKKRHRGC